MVKKKWKARTCLAAMTALSALSLPFFSGLQAHATEASQDAEVHELAVVSVGGPGEATDSGFFVPVKVENYAGHDVEVYIDDLAETDGSKLESSEKAVFHAGAQETVASGFTIPGKPRSVTGTVRLSVEGTDMDSKWIQFSDGIISGSSLSTAVKEESVFYADDAGNTETYGTSVNPAADDAVDPGFSQTVWPAVEHSAGTVIAVVAAVIAVISMPVVWLVIKKKKGRSEAL